MDTAAAELRRIERDLPDGAQARLVALDTPLHTVLDIDLPEQVDMPVASAVYFSVAEALANVTKHAGAKLDLVPSDDDNRRVLPVLAYLDS